MSSHAPNSKMGAQPCAPTPTSFDGLILIDKPAGMTSHDVVDRVRRIAKTRRVGHAGTLDPFATGLLIVGINKGTKMLTGLVGLDKTYQTTAMLGATSDTDDVEGIITNCQLPIAHSSKSKSVISNQQSAIPPMRDDVEQALDLFRGGYVQTAPAFSAKKVGGKKLYELARKGKMEGVVLPTKDVKIYDLHITSYEWPMLSFDVSCSSGTYIRSLARDIGEALHVGAYLTALRRTRIGEFDVKEAKRLEKLNPENIEELIVKKGDPPDRPYAS
ncbi:MAG: tRNA pseudouridine(55) synthase TruB [Patescibacteria group bacterium]